MLECLMLDVALGLQCYSMLVCLFCTPLGWSQKCGRQDMSKAEVIQGLSLYIYMIYIYIY